MRTFIAIATLVSALACTAAAQALEPVNLPAPRTEGGKPLLTVLKERRSQRAIADTPVPQQLLSDLLWAAWGFNRPEEGKRTAPTANNKQNMDVYVVLAEGAYLYDAKANRLEPVVAGDIRPAVGKQEYAQKAPLNLVYVARTRDDVDAEQQALYGGAHAGFIGENVYLFCASEGLATTVRAYFDKDALTKALELGAGQRVILTQTVGYPAAK